MTAPPASNSRPSWSGPVAAVLFAAITLMLIQGTLPLTGGRLVYPVDDSYIHMAVAKTVAVHGTWGVSPGRFEPASSSPLWTFLLSVVYRLFGPSESAPLILALGIALVVVLVLDRMLAAAIPRPGQRAATVLGIALLIPLPGLVYTAMEAPLHVLLTLLLVGTVLRLLGEPPGRPPGTSVVRPALAVLALSALSVLTRFESLFLIGVLGLMALAGRRMTLAASLGAGTALAVGGYAAWSLAQGGLWLPNAVLLKSQASHLHSATEWRWFLERIPRIFAVRRSSHMVALILAAVCVLLTRRGTTDPAEATGRRMLVVFLPATFFHLQFADIGSFFRYEAYLVALALPALAAVLVRRVARPAARILSRRAVLPARLAWAALAVALAVPIVVRSTRPYAWSALAGRNIYEQQVQMGRFVGEHFPGRTVAVNDLGAVGYFGEARVVDLAGLATTAVARAKLARRYRTEFIDSLCAAEGVEVALLYESWFVRFGGLPRAWRPIAYWTIPDNIVAAADRVTIFATRAGSVEAVRGAVLAFRARMPARVAVEIVD